MSFAVRATLVAFQGDPEHYPCHAGYKIGDTITFDGEKMEGKICPDVLSSLADTMSKIYYAGPRYLDPIGYGSFWYAPVSYCDESKIVFDGAGFANKKEGFNEPPHHIRELQPPGTAAWPPVDRKPFLQNVSVMCPDSRTAAVFLVEAYDVSMGSHDAPYGYRQMTFLDRVVKAGNKYPLADIMKLFTDYEINEIYPALSDIIISVLFDELFMLGYAEIHDGIVSVTDKGKERVLRFKSEVSEETVKALKL